LKMEFLQPCSKLKLYVSFASSQPSARGLGG
jgi:hypothetical protein